MRDKIREVVKHGGGLWITHVPEMFSLRADLGSWIKSEYAFACAARILDTPLLFVRLDCVGIESTTVYIDLADFASLQTVVLCGVRGPRPGLPDELFVQLDFDEFVGVLRPIWNL